MAQNQQELRILLTANIDELKKSLKNAEGDFGAMAESIRKAIKSLPTKGVMGDAFKQSVKDADKLLAQLDRLAAKQKVTPRENILGTQKPLLFANALGDTASKAMLSQQSAALDKMTLAQKQSFVESNRGIKENAAVVKVAQTQIRAELKQTTEAERVLITSQHELSKSARLAQGSWITQRYALYDVSSGLRSASQAMLGYSVGAVSAAAKQESAFSRIQKTQIGKASAADLKLLEGELLTLSTQIPKTFDELSTIGMLGAQLGIGTNDLATFAETVSKFSTVTGVAIEASATAFGKLATSLHVLPSEFNNLGSAIAYVGVNAASTEEQILNTSKQIAAVADAAGFSAAEVVGLASAMASLSISPEEARGVLIPTFQEMDRAIRSFNESTGKGSQQLSIFAKLAGVSSAEFVSQWGDKTGGGASAIFQKFIAGLGSTDAGAALEKLNLAGNRTTKGLTSLGNNAVFVSQQIKDALTGMEQGTFLDGSFATTVEDIQSKLTMLESSFNNLYASIAGGPAALGVFGVMLDLITKLNDELRKLAESSRVGQFLMGLATTVVALGGVLLGLGSAIAVAVAGALALRVAAMNMIGIDATSKLALFALQLSGVRGAALEAAIGVRTVGVAGGVAAAGLETAAVSAGVAKVAIRGLMASTGVGILVVGLGMLIEKTLDLLWPVDTAKKGIKGLSAEEKKTKLTTEELASKFNTLVDSFTKAPDAIIATQDALYNFGAAIAQNGNDFSAYSESGRANLNALKAVVDKMAAESGGNADKLYSDIFNMMKALEAQGYLTADSAIYLQSVLDGLAPKLTISGPPTGSFDLKSFLEGTKKSAGQTETALQKLQKTVKKLFESTNNIIDVYSAIRSLGTSLSTSKDWSKYTENGSANIKNLLSLIDSVVTKSGGSKKKAVTDLASLRDALIQMGLGSKVALDLIDKAITKIGGTSKKTAKSVAKDVVAMVKAIQEGLASATQGDVIRTLSDYVNELKGVISSAFDIRYGAATALDAISSSWIDLKNAAADAAITIKTANDEINSLTADKGILQYQLGIAKKYGDTARAAQISAELAKIDAQIAAKQQDIAAAQAASDRSLTGNTAAAIDNRAKIRALVMQYNDYLTSLANTGMSATDLKAKAAQLAQEFLAQGESLGFSRTELLAYTDAFQQDFTKVIDNLPSNITVTVDTDPALRAIREFVAQAETELAKINGMFGGSVSTPVDNRPTMVFSAWDAAPPSVQAQYRPVFPPTSRLASGGLVTGPGSSTSDSIAAQLSNGEFVMNANAVKTYGVDFMNSLNQSRIIAPAYSSPAVNAAGSSSMVYLSPEDRQLLRAAIDRPVNLYTDNQRIAASANAGNVILAQRGIN